MMNTENHEYVTKQELGETKQELLEMMDNLVTKNMFHQEMKRLEMTTVKAVG